MTSSVLVTGASGFLGRSTISSLIARGFDVVSLGRTDPLEEDVRHVECDLLDAAERADAVSSIRATHLLHLAWDLTPGAYTKSPANFDWLAASIQLARDFAAGGGRRIVVAGTCFEYEWSVPTLREDGPIRPGSVYGQCKDLLRRALEAYAGSDGPDLSWARLFFLYGPGENEHRLAGAVTSSLLRGEPVATSTGSQKRDYMYVGDAGRALGELLGSDVTGPINIGSGRAIPVRALVEALALEIGRADLVDYGARPSPDEPEVVAADIGRLTDELGFESTFDLESGVTATVDWWKQAVG
jgi:nucleoside-diphosphate-sugar epimerase